MFCRQLSAQKPPSDASSVASSESFINRKALKRSFSSFSPMINVHQCERSFPHLFKLFRDATETQLQRMALVSKGTSSPCRSQDDPRRCHTAGSRGQNACTSRPPKAHFSDCQVTSLLQEAPKRLQLLLIEKVFQEGPLLEIGQTAGERMRLLSSVPNLQQAPQPATQLQPSGSGLTVTVDLRLKHSRHVPVCSCHPDASARVNLGNPKFNHYGDLVPGS